MCGATRATISAAGGSTPSSISSRAAASLHRSKHADTYRWARPGGDVYVKVYRRYRRWTAIKDWFRPSKAVHVQRVSAALAARGIRRARRARRSAKSAAASAVRRSFCRDGGARRRADRGAGRRAARRPAIRRRSGASAALLETLGREVARLHAAGVVAGRPRARERLDRARRRRARDRVPRSRSHPARRAPAPGARRAGTWCS